MKAQSLLILFCASFVSIGCARHGSYYGAGYPRMITTGVSSAYVVEPVYREVYHEPGYGDIRYRDESSHYRRHHQRQSPARAYTNRKPVRYDRNHEREFGNRNRATEFNGLRHQNRQHNTLENHQGQPERSRPFSQHRHKEDRDRARGNARQRVDKYNRTTVGPQTRAGRSFSPEMRRAKMKVEHKGR